jgi:hypothetical protein
MIEGAHPLYLGSFDNLIGKQVNMITPDKFTFFLDSGAYSAWSRGTTIDIDEYIAFIKANIECIEVCACLDCIPGAPGRSATSQEREAAAELTWKNYLYMKAEGVDPLPVFHYGEDFRFLDRMIGHGCEYIGIGGLVGIPSDKRRAWLDRLFVRLTDKDGFPLLKTHGFGMTAVPLIFRYPWYSVDSTTWIKITANGAVYLPAMVNDEFVFDQAPSTITVSSRNPKQATGGKAANTMSESMRKILDRWLAICGKTYEEVASDYYHRAVCNVIYFKKVSEAKAVHPFKRDRITNSPMWG